MAKYLFPKHYRGAPAAVNDVPMDQWALEYVEVSYADDLLADGAGAIAYLLKDRVAAIDESSTRSTGWRSAVRCSTPRSSPSCW